MIQNDTKVASGGSSHLDTFAYIIFIYLYILTMLPMTLICMYILFSCWLCFLAFHVKQELPLG